MGAAEDMAVTAAAAEVMSRAGHRTRMSRIGIGRKVINTEEEPSC